MSVFIVAEAGVNHLGDRAKMLAFCDAAKACGADAVKFQAYDTEALCYRRGIPFYKTTPEELAKGWLNAKLCPDDAFALLKRAELSNADLDAIAAHCKAINFRWFASVFDPSQVERVLSRGACALKIAHTDVGYDDLECAVIDARTSVPVYVSITPLHQRWWGSGVHCMPHYPAKEACLQWVGPLRRGFSSHCVDWTAPAAAGVMLQGDGYVEAHLKMSDGDPEAPWSLSVADFRRMVDRVREAEQWL